MEAATLDEYRAHLNVEDHVNRDAERLIASYVDIRSVDGSSVDLDPRPGHVVDPAANREYHPDTGRLTPGRDGLTIKESSGKIEIQSIDQRHPVPTWPDRSYHFIYAPDSRIATYTYNAEVEESGRKRKDAKLTQHPPVVFPVDQNGQVTSLRRTAQSLEEAAANKGANQPAQRAGELLTSALKWDDVVQKLDGTRDDRNSKPGEVVLPVVPRRELAFAVDADPVIGGQLGSYEDEGSDELWAVVIDDFDLQYNKGGFIVADGNRIEDRDYIVASFSGQVGENLVTAQLQSQAGTESVSWDKAKGTLTYEKVTDETYKY